MTNEITTAALTDRRTVLVDRLTAVTAAGPRRSKFKNGNLKAVTEQQVHTWEIVKARLQAKIELLDELIELIAEPEPESNWVPVTGSAVLVAWRSEDAHVRFNAASDEFLLRMNTPGAYGDYWARVFNGSSMLDFPEDVDATERAKAELNEALS